MESQSTSTQLVSYYKYAVQNLGYLATDPQNTRPGKPQPVQHVG